MIDLPFTAADAMHLPFADASFDAVTMSFGLRNVADPAAALAEFRRVTEAMSQAPVTQKTVRDYSRVFFASASDEVPDKQGRITVPPALREYAGLSKDCVVIGANTRVEVWDREAWETYLADREQAFAELEEEVLPGVL